MSEVRHTPGPWRSVHRPDHYSGNPDLYEIHWSDDGECIAEIVHGKADADLIAAAPDLLAALERLLELTEAGEASDMYGQEAARAAITKAKGEA